MTKLEFIFSLRDKLSGLPEDEVRDRIGFYVEMIEDRIEEGVSEEVAVSDMGSVDEIASQILSEVPLVKIVKEKIKPKRSLSAWEIVLIILGFPIWFPLLVAVFAIIISHYAVIWSLVISLWAVAISLFACFIGGILGGLIFIIGGNAPSGLAIISAGLICAGLAIFMTYGCREATRGTVTLTKKIALGIKRLFVKKEVSQ